MKLKNLISLYCRTKRIRQFCGACLAKLLTGRHELIGSSAKDRTAAFEGTSLFTHGIVFGGFVVVNVKDLSRFLLMKLGGIKFQRLLLQAGL
jgi:hypothetical protein